MRLILVVLVGLGSGIVSGMGMGGGTLFIPLSTIVLGLEQKVAQGINLLAFIPTAIVALIIHIKNHLVNFKVGVVIVLTGIITSIISAILANNIEGGVLRKIFGIFLLAVGIYQVWYAITMLVKKDTPEYKINFWYK